ncbi:MAG: hypothetical protein V4543_06765 [Bacteroidota bacterium]
MTKRLLRFSAPLLIAAGFFIYGCSDNKKTTMGDVYPGTLRCMPERVKLVDGAGDTIGYRITYDNKIQVASLVPYDANSGGEQAQNTILFKYDDDGLITEITDPVSGNLTNTIQNKHIVKSVRLAPGGTVTTEYDYDGDNLKSMKTSSTTSVEVKTKSYEAYEMGRPTIVKWFSNGTLTKSVKYKVDKFGNYSMKWEAPVTAGVPDTLVFTDTIAYDTAQPNYFYLTTSADPRPLEYRTDNPNPKNADHNANLITYIEHSELSDCQGMAKSTAVFKNKIRYKYLNVNYFGFYEDISITDENQCFAARNQGLAGNIWYLIQH